MGARTLGTIVSAGLMLAAATAAAQTTERRVLTLEGAKRIAAAAEAEARKNQWNVAIAVVDEAGLLVHYLRIDDTQTASPEIAIGKARTAAMFRRPTKAMEDAVAKGRPVVMTFPGAVPVQGGLPLVSGGRVIGGIGVSGVQSHQDEIVAKAGADVLE